LAQQLISIIDAPFSQVLSDGRSIMPSEFPNQVNPMHPRQGCQLREAITSEKLAVDRRPNSSQPERFPAAFFAAGSAGQRQ
jgi:hypothetical protein